jgi:serine/threonine protein kinase
MKHPNVVSYHGCDIVNNDIYLYMEHCNQGSLYDVIYKQDDELPGKQELRKKRRAGIKDPKLVRHYIKQTIEALVYLHSIDIVHRGLFSTI